MSQLHIGLPKYGLPYRQVHYWVRMRERPPYVMRYNGRLALYIPGHKT